MRITAMRVTTEGAGVRVTLRCGVLGWTEACERTVGGICGAVSQCVRGMGSLVGALPRGEETGRLNAYPLERVEVETLRVWPRGYRVVLERGPYRYEATCGEDVEEVLALWGGALTFFALKEKVITVDKDIRRNRQQAAKLGLLTKEDG